ncbi:hypothetical protein [Dictyobacter vulcani]|uniref:hypothetical protein n=1 Tax=Dictyobacter vulcani TaxID=2607529 RepID=UPI001386AD94|nr:hypothetical protein [Dictyobacter vulcani]
MFIFTFYMIFLASVAWCLHAVYVSPVNGAAYTLKQMAQQNTWDVQTDPLIPAVQEDGSNASTLHRSEKSELFQLTKGLRPGLLNRFRLPGIFMPFQFLMFLFIMNVAILSRVGWLYTHRNHR